MLSSLNILGSVWLLSDKCSFDWRYGYIFSLVLLILGYILMFLIVFVACCLLVGSTEKPKQRRRSNGLSSIEQATFTM